MAHDNGRKLVFQLTGAFAEFERTMIRQRIKAGLKRAVAPGREARPAEDRWRDRTEGAKAACERRGHLEGGEVARARDWHGPSHLKRAWLKALTAILPLSPSFLCVAPRVGGLFGFKFSSRRHPRKFGQKRFLAVRRSWRGHGVACFWVATSFGKNLSAAARPRERSEPPWPHLAIHAAEHEFPPPPRITARSACHRGSR